MKVLVFGSDGFIGRNVCNELRPDHEVIEARKNKSLDSNVLQVDLLDKDAIADALTKTNPEVIINCAGSVNNSENTDLNSSFTKNILDQVVKIGSTAKVIICGSASVYGQIDKKNTSIDEDRPLNASCGYGLSKLKEELLALEYRKFGKNNIVVLRIFNPIGPEMDDRFLLTNLLKQVEEVRSGVKNVIELSRLDAARDYISITDITTAFRSIVDNNPSHDVYNIGSGKSTTNKDLLEIILKNSKLSNKPKIIQTLDHPEPMVAARANIDRISSEFGWHPTHKLEDTIREIIHYEHR